MRVCILLCSLHSVVIKNVQGDNNDSRKFFLWGGRTTTTTTTDPLADIMKSLEVPPNYNPNWNYEPYWTFGEWVFEQEAPTASGTTTAKQMVCDGERCHFLYAHIGQVCGINQDTIIEHCKKKHWHWLDLYGYCDTSRIDNQVEGHQTFPTYCNLLKLQCENENTPELADRGKRYMLRHMGPCWESDKIIKPLSSIEAVMSRARGYLTRFDEVLGNLTTRAIN